MRLLRTVKISSTHPKNQVSNHLLVGGSVHSHLSTSDKVLNHVRIIQGDGINEVSIKEILETITILGFSADNIVFGMGGQLLGAPQRDDLKFAMKASAVCIDGVWKDIFKDPITDKGKTSKKGRVTLYKDENGYYSDVENPDKESVLQTVFENGKLYNEITFDQVRINSQQ